MMSGKEDNKGFHKEKKSLNKKIKTLINQESDENLKAVWKNARDQIHSIVSLTACGHSTLIHEAVIRRFMELLRVLIETANTDVNTKTSLYLTPLHYAAKCGSNNGNLLNIVNCKDDNGADEMISYIISKGAKLNERDVHGLTPLHYAVLGNNCPAVVQLIQSGADVECANHEGMTPLLIAVKQYNKELIEFLLKSRANYQSTDKFYCTVLHYACQSSTDLIIQTIYDFLENELEPEDVLCFFDQPNKILETPLHWAVKHQNYLIFEFLMDKGANPNLRTIKGETALHLAAQRGNEEITYMLIKRCSEIDGVDVERQTPLFKAIKSGQDKTTFLIINNGANVNHTDINEETPLLQAARLGNNCVCQALLQNGADILVRDKSNQTALFLAVSQNHHFVVETLIQANEGINLLEMIDDEGNTALHMSVSVGSLNITKSLVCACPAFWGRNKFGHTPLHVAAMLGRYKIFRLLLDFYPGAVYERDWHGNCAIHLVAKHGFAQIMIKLLEYPLQTGERNKRGWTPLFFAAAYNQVDCAKLLLDQGSEPDLRDKSHMTPIFVACQNGHADVVNLLLKHKADASLRMKQTDEQYPGWNSLDIAVDGGHIECVKSIIQSNSWESTLSNVTVDGSDQWNTPLKRMIRKLPEAAEIVMNKCISKNNQPENSPNYTIKFIFQYMEEGNIMSIADDKTNKPSNSESDLLEESEQSDTDTIYHTFQKPVISKLNNKAETPTRSRRFISPTKLMIKKGREELLYHPLVTAMLSYRSMWFAVIYYVVFTIYGLFLALFTSFMLLTEAPYMLRNETMQSSHDVCMELQISGLKAYQHDIGIPKYGTIFLSVVGLFYEILKITHFRLQYLNVENLLDSTIFILSLLTTIDTKLCLRQTGLREDWQWACGTVGVFLAWTNLLTFLRHEPFHGIFVIMLVSVTATFAKVLLIFSPCLIAFTLAFHALLVNQNAFRTTGNALIKTFTMTMGEFDVGEIKLPLSAETVLARFSSLGSTPNQYECRPNDEGHWMDRLFYKSYTQCIDTVKKLNAAVEKNAVDTEALEKQMDTMEKSLEAVQLQTLRIEKVLKEVVNQLNACTQTAIAEMVQEQSSKTVEEAF